MKEENKIIVEVGFYFHLLLSCFFLLFYKENLFCYHTMTK